MENVELKDTIKYLEHQRDKALNYFIDEVKNYRLYSDRDLHESLNTVLKTCRHLKDMEDATLAYNTFKR